ncbi:MAG: type 4a pilus biogenesis protein PilO [Candidatus Acidiferrales bacterium]
MSTKSKPWKKWVQIALGILVVLDLALLGLLWYGSSNAPFSQAAELQSLAQQAKLLSTDVARAQAIERDLSSVDKQCQKFYASEFLPSATGYSSLIQDLGEIAGHAGVKAGGVVFKQHEISGRGVTEISITASVEGDYSGLVHFINGLERSKNFYLLDGLTLASSSAGGIKLNLELRTYFRT